jgi:hypothetical protein
VKEKVVKRLRDSRDSIVKKRDHEKGFVIAEIPLRERKIA